MNFEILNGLLLDKFQLTTFCSYLKNGETKGFNLLAAIEQLIDSYNPEDTFSDYSVLTSEELSSIINANNLNSNMNVTLTSGFTTVGDLLNDINNGYANYMNRFDSDLSDILISLKDASGAPVTSVPMPEAVSDFKNSLGASVLERAAIESTDQINISDRIAKFSAIAENSININSDIFTDTLNYYKTMLVNNLSGVDIISKVFSDCGVTNITAGSPVVIKEYPISTYSGCSPLGSLSMNTYHEALRTTGEVIGSVCSAIWKGFSKVGKWIWGKAKKYTTETFVNPYDITDNGDNNTTHSFSGFQYQVENVTETAFFMSDYLLENRSKIEALQVLLNQNANQWYFIQTIGGEMAVMFRNVSFSSTNDNWYITANLDAVFKPYSLTEVAIANYDINDGLTPEQFLNYMNTQTGDRYLNTNAPEHELLNSFVNGTAVHWGILSSYIQESRGFSSRIYPNRFNHYTQGNVTNKDVFEVASGYKNDGYELCRWLPQSIYALDPLFNGYKSCQDIGQMGFLLLILMATLKYNNDIKTGNVVYYVPYMKEDFTISDGRFGIKTDEQNQNIAESIFQAIIIISVITLIAVTGKVIINTISNKLFWKRKQFISKCDAALWNGEKLSISDKRKYLRYQKKLNASSLINKGLQSTFNEDSNNNLFSALYDNVTGDLNNMSLSKIYEVIV